MEEAAAEADRRVSTAVEDVTARHRGGAQQTVSEYNEVAERYRERLEALSAEFEGEVGHLRERFREPPEAESPEDPLEGQWMYDSARDFTWQTEVFRRAQKRD
jgi:hypothetical protein